MRDDLDELLGDFARSQLDGQLGKTAPAFATARSRQSRRRRLLGGLLAILAIAVAFHFAESRGIRSAARPAAVAADNVNGAAQMVSEQFWYRDVPGPMEVLPDHTPVQIIYRQVYQVRTNNLNQSNATLTEATPAQLTLLVRRPVF